jgi:hypothetical protein
MALVTHFLVVNVLYLSQTQQCKDTNVQPANIYFVPLQRQLSRLRIHMVIVVQLFTANPYPPRDDVGRAVFGFCVAVTNEVLKEWPMTDPVNHPSCPKRNPHHLHYPDKQTNSTKQHQVDQKHESNTIETPATPPISIEISLNPVVANIAAMDHDLWPLSCPVVQDHPKKQNIPNAIHPRTMWVIRTIIFGMMVPMDSRPLFDTHAGRKPTPETKEVLEGRMQVKGTVRLGPMVVDRYGRNRDVSHHKQIDDIPPRCEGHAAKQKPIANSTHCVLPS